MSKGGGGKKNFIKNGRTGLSTLNLSPINADEACITGAVYLARRADYNKNLSRDRVMQNKMKDLRCNCCKKLLARTKDNQYLEIKCTRCKTLNVFNRNKN